MNTALVSTGRKESVDQGVPNDLEGERFSNVQFLRLVAARKRFENCDFTNCEFDSCYLRNCEFVSCNFTGTKFRNTNLRGSHFAYCTFDYADFSNTQVEVDIFDSNCPDRENILLKFARSLRVNFQQIGDSQAVNKAILVELQATRVHLRKAWASREPYYRKKYKWFSRLGVFLDWFKFILLDFFWGNGESPWKLARSFLIVLILIAIGDTVQLRDSDQLSNYLNAAIAAPEILLGVYQPKDFNGSVLSLIAGTRYVLFACLVSVLIKRLNRR